MSGKLLGGDCSYAYYIDAPNFLMDSTAIIAELDSVTPLGCDVDSVT